MERKYKDSGIEWIGKIPETWEVDIAKHVFKQRREKGNEVVCQLLAATQKYGMYPQNQLEGVVKVAVDTDLNQFKTVHKNDYVISLRSFQGGFEISDYEGVCSPAYQVFYATRPINSQYYKYLFKSDAFIQEINSLTVGIREGKNILYDDFVLLSIPIPSVLDQQQIASYLDKKCGEIDSLIALQEQMIEKLKAYKQSVITEAVTKGLDPDAKLVPSGIDWIGDIPEGWRILRIKKISSDYKAGPFGSALITGNLLHEGSILVYTPEHVADTSKISQNINNLYLQEERREEMSQFFVKAGDVVFPIVGSLGRAIIIDENMPEGIINQRLSKFSINREKIDEGYFMWLFGKSEFYAKYIEMNCRGSFIVNLTKVIVGDMPLPLPSLCEQQAIASYLNGKCADIDHLIALKQQKIESLKEYKKSVIYEAVTGKTIIE